MRIFSSRHQPACHHRLYFETQPGYAERSQKNVHSKHRNPRLDRNRGRFCFPADSSRTIWRVRKIGARCCMNHAAMNHAAKGLVKSIKGAAPSDQCYLTPFHKGDPIYDVSAACIRLVAEPRSVRQRKVRHLTPLIILTPAIHCFV